MRPMFKRFAKKLNSATSKRTKGLEQFRPGLELLEDRRLLTVASTASTQVLNNYNQNPLSFEPNLGQTDSQVQYLSQGQGYSLFLTPAEAVLSLQKQAATTAGVTVPAPPSRLHRSLPRYCPCK